jgi:hypothetical protein
MEAHVKILVLAAAAALLALPVAASEQTYRELYEAGGLGTISQAESRVGRILEAHGVSQECMGELTIDDGVAMHMIISDSEISAADKRDRVGRMLEERCG